MIFDTDPYRNMEMQMPSDARPRRTPGRPRSEEAHAAILDASIQLIRELGYDVVTMDAIAARAGVGKATLYRRWNGKEELVSEALERMLRGFPLPDTGTTRGDLMALMKTQLGMYADPASSRLLSGLVAAMARNPQIARVVRSTFYAARRDAMAEVVKRGIERGDLSPETDVAFALDVFNGPLFYRYLFTGDPLDDRVARSIVELMLRAFG